MTNHPITPLPELVQQWCHENGDEIKTSPRWYQIVATKAAQWGADQELEACLLWVGDGRRENLSQVIALRTARRPQPPSLKEQALLAIDTAVADGRLSPDVSNVVRRALEQLDD